MQLRTATLVLASFLTLSTFAAPPTPSRPFPIAPDPRLTPGALCAHPTEYRYPEKIAYCRRSVTGAEKDDVIGLYDDTFGYSIERMNRRLFKVDHYIPLCMGGANSLDNLWPQHVSVGIYTDPLEEATCQKMFEGKLRQARAIEIIREAKADAVRNAPRLVQMVRSL